MHDFGEYIPYEATARQIVLNDYTHETFLRSLIPGITNAQIEGIKEYLVGSVHDGIIIGLDMNPADDPLDVISAYQLGVNDGLNRKTD